MSIFTFLNFLRSIQSKRSDEELAAAYRQSGEQGVLAELFDRYLDLIYGVCLKYLKEPADAQDATIALYEHLLKKLREHEVTYVKGWLHTAAKNHCLMILRRNTDRYTTDEPLQFMQSEPEAHLKEVLEKEQTFSLLEYCVEQLPAEQQQCIRSFYLEGKCYNEIAGITGMEWNKVRSQIQNGRRNLKICMEKGEKAKTVT